MSDSLTVGDVELVAQNGVVTVYADGKCVGTITAQGLVESAALGDDRLSEQWESAQHPNAQ